MMGNIVCSAGFLSDHVTWVCVLAAALTSRASQSARQTAAALLHYCSSGDARILLAVQRHLCGVQDPNGDTSVVPSFLFLFSACDHT